MICTGVFAKPHAPGFPGQNLFTGKVMHSHEYRTSKGFENQRVLIVGIGNTAGDIAADLSYVASKVGINIHSFLFKTCELQPANSTDSFYEQVQNTGQ